MTLQELNQELEYEVLLKNADIEEELIPHAATLTYESNYVQLLYDYGIEITLIILNIIERREFYEQCEVLKRAIKYFNKVEKENLPTKLEKLKKYE